MIQPQSMSLDHNNNAIGKDKIHWKKTADCVLIWESFSLKKLQKTIWEIEGVPSSPNFFFRDYCCTLGVISSIRPVAF